MTTCLSLVTINPPFRMKPANHSPVIGLVATKRAVMMEVKIHTCSKREVISAISALYLIHDIPPLHIVCNVYKATSRGVPLLAPPLLGEVWLTCESKKSAR